MLNIMNFRTRLYNAPLELILTRFLFYCRTVIKRFDGFFENFTLKDLFFFTKLINLGCILDAYE